MDDRASVASSTTPYPRSHNLFQVYLRLRPAQSAASGAASGPERFIAIEEPTQGNGAPTHITLNPPNDRRRAIEKFAFTQVFEEDATQLDVFHCTNVVSLVEGVLAPHGGEGTDALLATLGVTGSGKTHTILGSRTQRGMTQLALDVIFRSLGHSILDCSSHANLESSIASSDASEASISAASAFLETVFAEASGPSRPSSRAPTPMIGEFPPPPTPSRRLLNRPSALPQQPDVSALSVSCDPSSEYAVVISMYEVYNDRIFDLLTPPIKSAATKEYRRRPLLFKSTETSPDRKVVAGLRKVVCGTLQQALMVLEAGLHERRVAGTGSNSVSSRSHGFFCVEVKKRARTAGRKHGGYREAAWGGSTLTIVDLAGSERARDAKTAGATLAEAGKINESLMYLGQCLQMQSDAASKDKPNVVPFRQCKLTELLFSNSFPSASSFSASVRRNPQKAVMIVTADPHGDFNATSQILRYSALAREITVPRIPSITQTILQATASAPAPAPCSSPLGSSPPLHHRPFFPPGSTAGSYNHTATSPNISRTYSPGLSSPGSGEDPHRGTMELAALEIARLSEELDYMRQAFAAEQQARTEAEAHLLSMEDRLLELEQAVREDCAAEFERRLDIEMARWRANMQVEMERGEEHWDRKIEVFERAVVATTVAVDEDIGDDQEDKENVLMEDINEENDRLRRDNEILRRELAGLSPTKRVPLQERGSDVSMQGLKHGGGEGVPSGNGHGNGNSLHRKMERLRVSDDNASVRSTSTGSPKKMRKLANKRWDSAMDEDDLF